MNFYAESLMSFKAVVFDLDGTLLDTLDDLADSANRVLAAGGYPEHPVDAYRYFVGDGLQILVERILPEENRTREAIRMLAEAFKEEYSRNWHVKSVMYDGIDIMLNGLQQSGLRLSVLSNKPHDFTCMCVRKMLPAWTFEPLLGARPGVAKKPDPIAALEIAARLGLDPGEILYLGDTATDMKTATGAGMYPVGALWGFRTAEELTQNGAARLISRPQQLLDLI
jgi:phosphoglycolate phosphatase